METFGPANDRAHGPCVLVVDDEPTLRRLMKRALIEKGLEVVEAGNGVEALERFGTCEVIAVVTDVRMPLMDGLELTEQLQSQAPKVPIILVSGSEEVRNRAGAQALGAFDFLAKPFDLFDLGSRVLGAIAAHPPASQGRRVA